MTVKTTDPFSDEVAVQLSDSMRRKAEEMAKREGVSLEDFILGAVEERIDRSKLLVPRDGAGAGVDTEPDGDNQQRVPGNLGE